MAKIIKLQEEYSSEKECRRDVALYNDGKAEEDRLYYLSYWNGDRHKRFYVPCTKETFVNWRNMLSAEHKRRDAESRCRVPSRRYKNKYIICREDCSRCPYGKDHRDKPFVRLEEEITDCYLLVNGFGGDPYSETEAAEERKILRNALLQFGKEDRRILVLFAKGLSDAQIGEKLHLAKSTVQYRRSKLIEALRKKFEEN